MKTLFTLIAILLMALLWAQRRANVETPAASESQSTLATPTPPGDASSLLYAAEKQIASNADSDPERFFTQHLAPLAALDAAAATNLLQKIASGPFREDFIARLAKLWAAQDAKSAFDWSNNLKNGGERIIAVNAAALEIAQANPEIAVNALESSNVRPDKNTLENLAQIWASADAATATEWALAKPSDDNRDAILARIAFVIAQKDPHQAASLIVKNVAPGDAQTEAAISILHRWAQQDWNAAKQWVDQFPAGPLRDRAESEIAGVKTHNGSLGAAK